MAWPSTSIGSSRHMHAHTFTHTHTHTNSFPYINCAEVTPQKWLHDTSPTELALAWVELRRAMAEQLTSDGIFLSPEHEKRWCLQTCGCEGVCVPLPHLEEMAGAPVRGAVRNVQLHWSSGWRRCFKEKLCLCFPHSLTVMGRKNECASGYFWLFPKSQHCSDLTNHIKAWASGRPVKPPKSIRAN